MSSCFYNRNKIFPKLESKPFSRLGLKKDVETFEIFLYKVDLFNPLNREKP